MIVRGVNAQRLREIVDSLGLEFDNFRAEGRGFGFRLIPPNSRAHYARRSPRPGYAGGKSRRLKATCYHGFRDFIRLAFEAGASRVQSAWGKWPTRELFEAELPRLRDRNVGSLAAPCRMVDLCECGDRAIGAAMLGDPSPVPEAARAVEPEHEVQFGTLSPDGTVSDVRSIRQSDMLKCSHVIMVADHYREDGSCRCDDPTEQAKLIAESGYTPADFTGAAHD